MVTHDRYLLDRVAGKIWAFQDQGIDEYLGNYSYYREKRDSMEITRKETGESRGDESASDSKLSKKDLRRARADIRKRTGKSSKFYEREIETVETELEKVNGELKDPALATDWSALDELMERQKTLSANLDELMEKWETALNEEKMLEDLKG